MEVVALIPVAKIILKGTCCLLWWVGQQWAKEKLKDDDFMQSKIISSLLIGLDTVVEKLNKEAKKDLGASICLYKEGLTYLYDVLGKINKTTVQMEKEAQRSRRSAVSTRTVCDYLKTAKYTEMDESAKASLSRAKRAFSEATLKATEAFSNENLGSSERVQAMSIRIMAKILMDIENPLNALPACISCINDLHSTDMIKKIFQVALSKKGKHSPFKREVDAKGFECVCQLHHLIYKVTELVGKGRGPWSLPCIVIESAKEKIDPLRDVRVAETLRKLDLGHLCLTRHVDQAVEKEADKLKSARDVATNNQGKIAVVDNGDNKIKVFDRNGVMQLSFNPLCRRLEDEDVLGVTTDGEGNFLLLVKIDKYHYDVYVFDKNGKPHRKFHLREGILLCSPIVNNSNEMFVLKKEVQEEAVSKYAVVERYKDGQYIASFGHNVLKQPKDITVAEDGRVMVLNNNGDVDVFDAQGNHLEVTSFGVVSAEAIAFHSESKHAVISSISEGTVKISIFSERGECVHSIHLGEQTSGREDKRLIAPKLTVTLDGRITVLAGFVGESKVLVM